MAAARSPIAAEIRTTITVAAPLAAANLAQMAMQVTNAVMVGHLGAVALAAAGLGNALNATLLMTSQGLLTAVAPLAAHAIGAGDHPTAGRVAGGGPIVPAALAGSTVIVPIAPPPPPARPRFAPPPVAAGRRFFLAVCLGGPGLSRVAG